MWINIPLYPGFCLPPVKSRVSDMAWLFINERIGAYVSTEIVWLTEAIKSKKFKSSVLDVSIANPLHFRGKDWC